MPYISTILLITMWLLLEKFPKEDWNQPPKEDRAKRPKKGLTTPELNSLSIYRQKQSLGQQQDSGSLHPKGVGT